MFTTGLWWFYLERLLVFWCCSHSLSVLTGEPACGLTNVKTNQLWRLQEGSAAYVASLPPDLEHSHLRVLGATIQQFYSRREIWVLTAESQFIGPQDKINFKTDN